MTQSNLRAALVTNLDTRLHASTVLTVSGGQIALVGVREKDDHESAAYTEATCDTLELSPRRTVTLSVLVRRNN